MKIVGGILFVIGVFLFLAGLITKSGTTDMTLLGCLLMPGGLLLGYLLSPKKQPQVLVQQTPAAGAPEKTRLDTARELIEENKYDAARALLSTIDDPKAREWLAKIDKLDPK